MTDEQLLREAVEQMYTHVIKALKGVNDENDKLKQQIAQYRHALAELIEADSLVKDYNDPKATKRLQAAWAAVIRSLLDAA